MRGEHRLPACSDNAAISAAVPLSFSFILSSSFLLVVLIMDRKTAFIGEMLAVWMRFFCYFCDWANVCSLIVHREESCLVNETKGCSAHEVRSVYPKG